MSDPAFEQHRDRIINYLTECFAGDILTTEEYEKRVEQSNAARTQAELEAVIADLRSSRPRIGPANPPAPAQSRDLTAGRPTQRVMAILGEQDLSGNWMTKDSVLIQAFMGSVKCDLRGVNLFAENRIQIYALMAEVNIKVPEGIALVSSLAPILAEIKRKDRSPESLPGAPIVEIGGLVIMGEVKISS
jgi:hypothetical protein